MKIIKLSPPVEQYIACLAGENDPKLRGNIAVCEDEHYYFSEDGWFNYWLPEELVNKIKELMVEYETI